MKKLFLSTIFAFGVAGTAIAQDANTTDWGGFYAGGMIGHSSGTLDYSDIAPDPTFDIVGETTYGAFAGYNFQSGAFVYGAEVAYSTGGLPPVGYPTESHGSFIDLKARGGYAFNNALVYGVIGRSWTDYDEVAPNSWKLDGLNYGVGLDYMVTNKMFIGAEYLIRKVDGDTVNPGQIQESVIKSLHLRAGWKF